MIMIILGEIRYIATGNKQFYWGDSAMLRKYNHVDFSQETRLLEKMEQFIGENGTVYWRKWNSLLEKMEQFIGENGTVYWRKWNSLLEKMEQFIGENGTVFSIMITPLYFVTLIEL